MLGTSRSPVLVTAVAALAALNLLACAAGPHGALAATEAPAEEHIPLPPPERGLPPDPMSSTETGGQMFNVPPPPFSEGIFPCNDCHEDLDTDPTPRKLKEEHRKIKLKHDEENRWCLDCHSTENRDQLHLASGKQLPFEKSYLLCGQCHGEKLRDWKAGVHGKRTGMWNGDKEYLLCAHCHNPHSPRFKPLAPEPPPLRPTDIRK